jgi:hypothetical protein
MTEETKPMHPAQIDSIRGVMFVQGFIEARQPAKDRAFEDPQTFANYRIVRDEARLVYVGVRDERHPEPIEVMRETMFVEGFVAARKPPQDLVDATTREARAAYDEYRRNMNRLAAALHQRTRDDARADRAADHTEVPGEPREMSFTINPEVLAFLKENPDKPTNELAQLWIDVLAKARERTK